MLADSDLLYSIFEQHLFSALVENETSDEFLARVVRDYLARLTRLHAVIPREHYASVESDIREEVLEMLRKKTYGHYNLAAFRKAHGVETAQEQSLREPVKKEKARRTRRAC
jgi:hypothetical protein